MRNHATSLLTLAGTRGCGKIAVSIILLGLTPATGLSGELSATVASGTASQSRCAFVGDTLIPRLAMGVRRVDGEDIDFLELRGSPGATTVSRQAPLFRPFFIAKSRTDATGEVWYLLQDGYTAAKPLGWARGKHLHHFDSRYAYSFANRKREQLAELHDDSKESYERLLAQIAGNPDGGKDTVVVKERPDAETWDPLTIDDVVPFVELRVPPERRNREYPDTTPTFRFGIPAENRLVHMGAICGGPVDAKRLHELKAAIDEEKGLEILFVVDETTSMNTFMKQVAKFIRGAGELAVERPVPTRIAVCSYTDGPPGKRVKLGEFKVTKGPADVNELANAVEGLGYDLPPDPYPDPPERMLEGLRDALKGRQHSLEFQQGASLFVAVVGDTGHQPDDPDKQKLVKEVGGLIKKTAASVYFMHVGRRLTPDEKLFKDDFQAIQQVAVASGVVKEKIVYQPAEESDLNDALERARKAVEEERRRMQQQIERMESRSPYTEPGPKLIEAIERRGIDRAKFDNLHLQYFVPSRGWLFHPTSQETVKARSQLRELFLLAAPEREAVKRLFDGLRDSLTKGEQIDGDAVIGTFAKDLAAAAGDATITLRVASAWNRIPRERRSVGVFMEDVFGLRLKTALPFPPIAYVKDRPAARQEIDRMLARIGRLGEAFKDDGEAAFWFEAASLVP